MRSNVLRRIFILVLVLLAISAAGAGFYTFRQRQIRAKFVQVRNEGLAAMQAGDNAQAVDRFSTYLQRYPDDIEVMVAFTKVRPLVELPKNGHLAETIVELRRLLRLAPDRVEQRRALLALYVRTGYLTEALEAANILQSQSAETVESLRLRTGVEIRLQKFPDALHTVDRWAALAPDDISADLSKLFVLRKANHPSQEILDISQKLLKAAPDDPRTHLLRGYAYALCDDRVKAAEHLRAAATATPSNPDPMFIKLLEEQLDGMELFDESLSILERVYAATHNVEQREQLIRRYWELGRVADVVKLVDAKQIQDPNTSDNILAFDAFALHQLGRDSEIAPIRAALAGRKYDAVAIAWGMLIDEVFNPGASNAQRLFNACKDALQTDPGNAYLSYFEGEAYARLNESDLAIGAWRKSAESSQTWYIPMVRLAQALGETSRYEFAFQSAQEGVRRAPHNSTAIITWARIWAISIDNGRRDDSAKLLDLVTQIQQQLHNENQTLSIRIALLGRAGKIEEARKALADALDSKVSLDEATVLHLAALSQHDKLGLEQQCFDRTQKDHGITPDLAYARAIQQFVDGKNAQGLTAFDAYRSKVKDPDAIAWRLQRARYLDIVQDPGAQPAIVALADQQPKNLQVQQFAISARSPRDNGVFMDRTVGRMRELTGEGGVAWRLARARWLLQFTTSDAQNDQAIGILNDVSRLSPDLVDARVLLARAYERAHKLTDSADQLTIAAKLSPNATSIGLYLARILQARGDFERAREQLERVADRKLPDANERRQAAVLLAQQGEPQRAIELIEEANRQSTEQGSEDLLLAELYRERNQPEKAEAICRKLLEKPSTAIIEFAADLVASQGRKEEAARILSALDRLKLDPGTKELVLADYASRHDTADSAIKLFRAATKAAPKEPRAWQSLVVMCLSTGDADQAIAANTQAMAELPDDRTFRAIGQESTLLKSAIPDLSLRPLALAYAMDPTDDSALQAVRLILDGVKKHLPLRQLLPQLGQLAQRSPRLLPLQRYLAAAYVQVGQLDDAIAAATRATEAAPNAPESFELLTASFQAAERWAEVLHSAKQWRDLTLSNPLPADLAIARAQIALNQPLAAMKQLQPYMADATSKTYDAARETYARAQAVTANSNSAAIMQPMLAQGARGREGWMIFAIQNLESEVAAGWLQRVTPLIPADAEQEHILLSESWGELASRTGNAQYSQAARAALAAFVDPHTPSPDVMLTMGIREEQAENFDAAESWYRRAIASKGIAESQALAARNNLAMALAKHGAALKEAEDLATANVRNHPEIAPLYDTLAFIQTKGKNYDAALTNFNAAIRLQPRNPLYRLHLAALLRETGHTGEAKKMLQDFDNLNPNLGRMSLTNRRQLDTLRAELSKVAQFGN